MNAPMTLEEIIKFDAACCPDISVKIGWSLGTVCITDPTGEHEDIFMQGDEGVEWIEQLERLTDAAPEVLFEDAIKHLAKPYVDVLWG